jgi:Co/Zn/Cd efflux system component
LKDLKMRVPPVALLAICAAITAVFANYIPIMRFTVPIWLVLLELIAGVIFLAPAVFSFVKHKTTVSPLSTSEATTLVTSGVFSITRNPMYVGMLLILVSIALWFETISGLIAIPLFIIIIDRFQIRVEEKHLIEKFGQAYRDYAQRVPRWLIIRGELLKMDDANKACGCSGDPKFDGVDPAYKRILWVVIAINAIMFIVEMSAGKLAGSQALQADALDFLGDSLTYGLSLAVIGMSLKARSMAALLKGVSLLLMGLWVFGSTVYQVLILGVPEAQIMGVIGLLALAANLASVFLLMRYKDGDANVRSVWLCSRNDAIGNVAVMIASVAVWFTMSAWPDLIVAAIMAGLFLRSAQLILIQAWQECRSGEDLGALESHGHKEGHDHAH